MPDDEQQPGPQIVPEKADGSEAPRPRPGNGDREDPNDEKRGAADPDHPDSF